MTKCPECLAPVTFPEGAERTVCAACNRKLRRPPPKAAIPVGPPPPPPWPGRSVPTTLLALVHFGFALVPAAVGVLVLVWGEAGARRGAADEEGETARLMLGAIVLLVFAVVVVGAGVSAWACERSGYFLSLFVAVAVGAAAGAYAAVDHWAVALLGFALWPGVPYAGFVLVMLALPGVRRDFWSAPG